MTGVQTCALPICVGGGSQLWVPPAACVLSLPITPSPPRDHVSPGRCLYGGAAASPPVTMRNLPWPAPPPSHFLGGIRRELTAQTPRLHRGEGRGRGRVRKRSSGQARLLLSAPLPGTHAAQLWEPSTYGRITWVWRAWSGLCVGKGSLRPGWTPSHSQLQDLGVRGPARNLQQLLNACALSANTTASPGPSTSPMCSRMRPAGCCVPSFVTTCALSAVLRASVPTPVVSARSLARATPPSTAIPPATQLARGYPGLIRRGCRTRGIAEEEQQAREQRAREQRRRPVQVAGETRCGGDLPQAVAESFGASMKWG